MRRLIMLAVLLFAPAVMAGDHWNEPSYLRNWQARFWLGANVNPEGVGPKADVEVRWGPRWGMKLGAGLYHVKVLRQDSAPGPTYGTHGSWWSEPTPEPMPVTAGAVEHTEQDWGVDLMFSWTARQGQ